jgi:hypothetical protein
MNCKLRTLICELCVAHETRRGELRDSTERGVLVEEVWGEWLCITYETARACEGKPPTMLPRPGLCYSSYRHQLESIVWYCTVSASRETFKRPRPRCFRPSGARSVQWGGHGMGGGVGSVGTVVLVLMSCGAAARTPGTDTGLWLAEDGS